MTTRAAAAAAEIASQTTADLFLAASQEWSDNQRVVDARRLEIADTLIAKVDAAVRERLITRGLMSRGLDPPYRLSLDVPADKKDLKDLFPWDRNLQTRFAKGLGFSDDGSVLFACGPVYYQGNPVIEVHIARR